MIKNGHLEVGPEYQMGKEITYSALGKPIRESSLGDCDGSANADENRESLHFELRKKLMVEID